MGATEDLINAKAAELDGKFTKRIDNLQAQINALKKQAAPTPARPPQGRTR